MIEEKELTRNFCPRCLIKDKDSFPLYCKRCGNSDLIPKPLNSPEWKDGVETKFIQDETVSKVEFIEQKPKIEIDPLVINQLKQPFAFVTGQAGSGKSTAIRLMAELDPTYIELTSTTGISAINLGGRTINSVLKYFNTKSLESSWRDGKLQWNLRKIRAQKRVLGIEEVSMLSAEQLDLICSAVDEINNDRSGRELGIHLIGDYCQLPVIEGNPSFKAENWDRFEKNTIHLKKIWRQDNIEFIKAMNFARSGDGNSCVTQLINCGVKFVDKANNNFDGTTLISLNIGVDAFNDQRLKQLTTPMIRTVPKKQGLQLKEWEKLIPIELRFKIGAYVMILSNDIPNFNYVNGDASYIKSYDKITDKFEVELVRNGKIVKIGRIMRENLSDKAPTNSNFTNGFTPYLSRNSPGDWIIGNISYHPLRLAWASSIHKAQGLSLDRVQIDTRANFCSAPGMLYVALSRARTAEGLVLIGNPVEIAKKIKTSNEVKKWI